MTSMRELIKATYLVTADMPFDPEKRAKAVALGQTTDTWTPVDHKDQERLERHRGVVLDLQPPRQVNGVTSAMFTIGFPPENTQRDIATLLVMVFGKVSMDGRIRLLDLELPEAFLDHLPGPRFGVPGLRQLAGVLDRPLLMSIFKPCVGLPPKELAEMFQQQALGGTDIVKDDEILPDLDTCPSEQRLELCLEAAEAACRETGHRTLYALNLTGPASGLVERANNLVSRGANCLLVNVLAYGYGILEDLARHPQVKVPIVAHPALAGALGSAPEHGIAYRVVLGTLMRAAGADAVLFPSSYGTVALPREEIHGITEALSAPLKGVKPAFPGPSAGIHPGLVTQILQDYGLDVIINAGGGVHGHPKGGRAGALAFRQAIDLALQGLPLKGNQEAPELAEALRLWGA